MDVAAYLDRVGLAPEAVAPPDREALRALQRAHVTTIPWETLAVAGDPFGPADGAGVSLALDDLAEKLLARERGGFCYEHNRLFAAVLDDLGFDVGVRAAKMLGDDGEVGNPAAHAALVVAVGGERAVVDVGLGVPPMRRPTPLAGEATTDEAGVAWRVVDADRPDADYRTQFREPGEREWTDRYVFRDVDRDWDHFAATCEHLATAPESPFTDDPVVSLATPAGYVQLKPDRVVEREGQRRVARPIREPEWRERLRTTFGLDPGWRDEAAE